MYWATGELCIKGVIGDQSCARLTVLGLSSISAGGPERPGISLPVIGFNIRIECIFKLLTK